MRDVKSLSDALATYEAAVRKRETAEAVYGEVCARESEAPDIGEIMDRVGAQESCMRASMAEKISHSKLIDALRAAIQSESANQSRAFEDGARWMRERAEGVAREWMHFTGCRADENTDGLNPETRMYARGHYHARSAIAAGIAAFPLQPEGERSDA